MTDIVEINGLKFTMTCFACPEQYDVTDGTGQEVAYIRLRWGNLSVTCPGVQGELVYEHHFEDHFTGCFSDDEERNYHLNKAAKAIKIWCKKND